MRPIPTIADEILFENQWLLVLGGGFKFDPSYEVVSKSASTTSYYPCGSGIARIICKKVIEWNDPDKTPREEEVEAFFEPLVWLNSYPLEVN